LQKKKVKSGCLFSRKRQ